MATPPVPETQSGVVSAPPPQRADRDSRDSDSDTAPRSPSWVPGLRNSSPRGLVIKIVLLCLVDALAVYGVLALIANQQWPGLVAMVIGAIAVNYVYLSSKTVPLKYLLPGLIFLLVYQVYVVLYTGYTAFTNYGDGHNDTKAAAVSAILGATESRVPDSPAYKLTVVEKDGKLGFLVTAPNGTAELGSAEQPLKPAPKAQKDSSGKAVNVPGWTTLNFGQILQRQNDVTRLRVPLSDDAEKGSLRTEDGSTAYVYVSKYTYDEKSGNLVPRGSGPVLRDDGNGNFVGPDGKAIQPGWKVNVGFSNFTRIFGNAEIRGPFLGVLVWTFAFAILSVVTTFGFGLLLALVLNDERMRFRKGYRSLLLLPYAIPAFMSALIWAGLLNTDFGFVNQILLGGAHVAWLSDAWLARLSIIVVNLWLGFPYMFLICTGALQAIPAELTEAARVDGAGGFRIFRSVKLPLLLVAVAPLLIASFAFNFNNFNTIFMLTGGGPKILDAKVDVGSTDILISFVYKLAFGGMNRQYGFACAVSILIFIIVASISAISFRKTRALEELN
ncbi:MAG: ABC transporter permease subunit [Actinomycetales bacterium]